MRWMTRPYPGPDEEIYVVHKLFRGESFGLHGEWGSLTDGPVTDPEIVAALIRDEFPPSGPGPDRHTLRVWVICQGAVTDVTAEVIREWENADAE